MRKLLTTGAGVTALLVLAIPRGAAAAEMSAKDVVNAFDQMAFFDHKPKQAIETYVAADAIEHDPAVGNGRAAMLHFLDGHDWSKGTMADHIDRVIAEGDIVLVHHHLTGAGTDHGTVADDIFRVEHGQIVEHWDVMQAIPAKTANGNAMY